MEAARAAPGGRRENLSLKLAPRTRRQKDSLNAAFERFYREHVAEVYQYALAVLGNPPDAEEVTQQTFLNAYRAFQRGERPRKAHNWLVKIAHNVCRMRWRQSGRRPREVPLEHAGEPAARDDEKPSLDEVLSALARLPFNQRAAIVMREVEDRSIAEIAEVLGVTVAAVEALLFRARGNLRARRKALAGALGIGPVPASLGSCFGGGGGLIGAGGGALGSGLALKAAAVVATGVLAGGLGFKAVDAVGTPDPPTARPVQVHGRPLAPTQLRPPVPVRQLSVGVAAFHRPAPAVSAQGALPPTNDRPSEGGVSGFALEPAAVSTVSSSPANAVNSVVAAVPQPPAIAPTTVAVTTPVASVTVTVPVVELPTPPPLP
jgi:RNA polymerase sigma-70 factor (ECF subfamily)